MSYFLIVVLHVDDKTYEGFVNKAFGRQFLCNSLNFDSQLAVGFQAVFCRFFRLSVRLLEFCDLRSKHNMLGKNDVAQSDNSLVPCRPFDIFDSLIKLYIAKQSPILSNQLPYLEVLKSIFVLLIVVVSFFFMPC